MGIDRQDSPRRHASVFRTIAFSASMQSCGVRFFISINRLSFAEKSHFFLSLCNFFYSFSFVRNVFIVSIAKIKWLTGIISFCQFFHWILLVFTRSHFTNMIYKVLYSWSLSLYISMLHFRPWDEYYATTSWRQELDNRQTKKKERKTKKL